ncbi:ATP-dependent helicase [Herbiconiux sp. CPCC 205716]|uniref:DNA 3'-5' helicase n=1 Tax=Herbiconiux gentiana TaxID=2970912 RepID=A0ABT2GG76_9MICO|nr:ATP-dependent DNA helicase [Herbiconiux gentiana]MCS5715228.1 ATP-dependent helicase [Herbiconiux gentiana]
MSDALFDLADLDDPRAFVAPRGGEASSLPPEAEAAHPSPAVGADSRSPRDEAELLSPGEGAAHPSPGTVSASGAERAGDLISAVEIADRLGLPRPTEQQRAVIEAPLDPRIVVAGAGSGKTETMANRVVWLIANGLVQVPEVLGLTFTRKAAGELAERIRRRLAQLTEARVTEREPDPFDAPEIATYNAFANSIFRENAVLIGREGEAAVLSEASAWQLARSVVVASRDERLLGIDRSVDVVTSAVLNLSRALSENVTESGPVSRYADRFAALADLPKGKSSRGGAVFGYLESAIAPVAALPLLLDLADEYAAEKVRRGYVEFSDQIALALAIVESTPRVVADYRDRFRVVLLDEYQDTSVVQTRLLSVLFREHAVMAVGDPHQSIYGWRGASAANLARFRADFGDTRRGAGKATDVAPVAPVRADPIIGASAVDVAGASAVGTPTGGERVPATKGAPPFALSTSWRNPEVVLKAANTLVRPLTATSGIPVEELGPRPNVAAGRLDVGFSETVRDEAEQVAAWLEQQLRARPDGTRPSAALLCRSVKKIEPFTAALEAKGVRYHVLGIGGLLGQPAVADLVSTLRVLYYPTAGPDLLRVLAGARWRIGTKDLVALRALASWIAERDHRFQKLEPEVSGRLRGSVVDDEDRSIVDALDFLATARPDHRALEPFSEVGLDRLRRAAAQFAHLRTRAGLGLVDFVDLVQQELLLDIEVLASPHHTLGRASLDAFTEQLTSFLALDPTAGLGDFLSWLEEAEKRDRLEPRSEEAEPGTVQILTIHGAKGLEWDVVAIPRMVEGELPGDPRSSRGWLSFGELPFDFRGDSAELPKLAWQGIDTQSDFKPALDAFQADNAAQYAAEQRRLIYVAVTRARERLLLTGSFWTTGVKRPRGPGLYLRELGSIGLVAEGVLPDAPEHEDNPLAEAENWVPWPRDPLGGRRSRVETAAAAVRAADPGASTPWDHDIELLLAERARLRDDVALDVPVRIPASRFKDYVSDPQAVVRALQRPMPERPYRQTRLGTRFHTWVEEMFRRDGADALVDLPTLGADHVDGLANYDLFDDFDDLDDFDGLDGLDDLGGANGLGAGDGLSGVDGVGGKDESDDLGDRDGVDPAGATDAGDDVAAGGGAAGTADAAAGGGAAVTGGPEASGDAAVGGAAGTGDAAAGGGDVVGGPSAEDQRFAELIETFRRSPFAARRPEEVEVEIHLVLGGRIVVCKIDAIFAGGGRFEVVDWKTGRAPVDAADLELKQLQLALYRLAYARWKGIDVDLVDASFYFVADDQVIRPDRLYSEAELEALLRDAAL